MGRIAELMEHPGEFASETAHRLAHRPKSTIGTLVVVGLLVFLGVSLWPELQRYLRMKRM